MTARPGLRHFTLPLFSLLWFIVLIVLVLVIVTFERIVIIAVSIDISSIIVCFYIASVVILLSLLL